MQSNGNKLNLDELAKKLKLDVRIESPPDKEEEAEGRYRRRKDAVLFGLTVALVATVSGICVWIVLATRFSAEEKKWAMSLLTLIVGGLVGYLTGKAAR